MAPAVDFVTTGEFDYAVQRPRRRAAVRGRGRHRLPRRRRHASGARRSQPPIHDLDAFPFVTDVYARASDHRALLHRLPAASLRVALHRPRLPQPLQLLPVAADHRRPRLPHALASITSSPRWRTRKRLFPQVREFFFDDDTFTDDRPRAEAIARGLGQLGITWSCNAKANVPYETLKVMKENGLRLLLVGFETGNQEILNNIRKGTRIDRAIEFMHDCHRLGILRARHVHRRPAGRNARDDRAHHRVRQGDRSLQSAGLAGGAVSGHRALSPGARRTAGCRPSATAGWCRATASRKRCCPTTGCRAQEMHAALERFYRAYYLRPRPILRIMKDMVRDREVMQRRLREAREFFSFMAQRRQPPPSGGARPAGAATRRPSRAVRVRRRGWRRRPDRLPSTSAARAAGRARRAGRRTRRCRRAAWPVRGRPPARRDAPG